MGNYYLSYGEDLSTERVIEKCPKATLITKCQLSDYRLKFCRYVGSVFATIEKHRDFCIPAILWYLENGESLMEEQLNQGFRQKEISIRWNEDSIIAFLFVMEGEQCGMPTEKLLNGILDGYEEHGFDPHALEDALDEVIRVAKKEGDENGSVF